MSVSQVNSCKLNSPASHILEHTISQSPMCASSQLLHDLPKGNHYSDF